MQRRADQIPPEGKERLLEAAKRLAQFYRTTGRPAEEAKWKAETTQRYGEEVQQRRKLADSGNVEALNSVAWLLATCGDASIRDGTGAVNYAKMAVEKTERKDANTLDTLAAAYAEAGQLDNAVSAQIEAMALLQDEHLKADFASRLRLYQANHPCHEQ